MRLLQQNRQEMTSYRNNSEVEGWRKLHQQFIGCEEREESLRLDDPGYPNSSMRSGSIPQEKKHR